MRTIYIGGGQRSKKSGGLKWKLLTFLILFCVVTVSALKVAAPTIVEKWINKKGADAIGYAFSIRDVKLSLGKGQVVLNDLKVYNPKTNTELLETPNLTIQVNWQDFVLSQEKMVSVNADKVDLILSEDFSSEIERIKTSGKPDKDFYLNAVDGKIGKLNIIEKKDDLSRTVVELNDVNVKVKDFTPLSINKKTQFSVSSNVAEGGKLNLSGKTTEENGKTPWTINGSFRQVPAEILNKIAGDKLPFSFLEPNLNADIVAQSEDGRITGEISPEIRKLNLLEERPGVPSRSIARILNEELTFTLPFTLKDELVLRYQETYAKLKNYRKYPAATSESVPGSPEKKATFWPF